MESLLIEGTFKTPAIKSDCNQGFIEIKGRSNPENSFEFYRPLANWIVQYARNPKDNTSVNIQLEHFNTSSSKCLIDIFKKLEPILTINKNVSVNWYYEDEDLMEAGEHFQKMTELPITLIAAG